MLVRDLFASSLETKSLIEVTKKKGGGHSEFLNKKNLFNNW